MKPIRKTMFHACISMTLNDAEGPSPPAAVAGETLNPGKPLCRRGQCSDWIIIMASVQRICWKLSHTQRRVPLLGGHDEVIQSRASILLRHRPACQVHD